MLSEDEGVKVIQTLLQVSGLIEPVATSRKHWREMNESEKIKTEEVHKAYLKQVN